MLLWTQRGAVLEGVRRMNIIVVGLTIINAKAKWKISNNIKYEKYVKDS